MSNIWQFMNNEPQQVLLNSRVCISLLTNRERNFYISTTCFVLDWVNYNDPWKESSRLENRILNMQDLRLNSPRTFLLTE